MLDYKRRRVEGKSEAEMEQTANFILLMDWIGTIAFALSGAVLAIEKNMDIFGINILAIATATGGGMIRDILIGRFPPVMFKNPVYVLIAAVTANICFVFFFIKARKKVAIPDNMVRVYARVFFWFDTLGLAAFSVDGVYAGMYVDSGRNGFLLTFLGVMTGVGGGVLRDILANQMPAILVRNIYASASVAGALVMTLCVQADVRLNTSILAGFFTVIVIRCLASHYKWNLPRVTSGRRG